LTTPVSAMALVVTGSVIGSFGAVFLKFGALALGKHWSTWIFNWRFVMGVSRGELSVLYPMVSLGYICTLMWSRIFFNERLTSSKFAGVGLILIGIVLLGLGNR
jgi:multidrug transporter EmrE-like cation transporter